MDSPGRETIKDRSCGGSMMGVVLGRSVRADLPSGEGEKKSSVHGISQVRILEWVAIPFSRESSRPRDQTHIYIGRRILYHKATWEAQSSLYLHLIPKSGSIQKIVEF